MDAETIYIKGEGGVIHQMTLPLPEALEQRLERGHISRVNADGTPYVDDVELTKPGPNDNKGKWIEWAVKKHAAEPEAAEAMTKQDLIDTFGGD